MFLNHYGIFKHACNEAHLHFESLFTNEKKNTVLSCRLSEEGEVGSFKPTGFELCPSAKHFTPKR